MIIFSRQYWLTHAEGDTRRTILLVSPLRAMSSYVILATAGGLDDAGNLALEKAGGEQRMLAENGGAATK